MENGPFRVSASGALTLDQWAWNRYTNGLWIESPAGVGFSYSNTSSDYHVGDERTAADIQSFLARFTHEYFPELQGHPVWLTGESYGGHCELTSKHRRICFSHLTPRHSACGQGDS